METIVTPSPGSMRSTWLRTGLWRIALGLLALAVIGARSRHPAAWWMSAAIGSIFTA